MSEIIKIEDIKKYKTIDLPELFDTLNFIVLDDGRYAYANRTDCTVNIIDPKNDFHCDIKLQLNSAGIIIAQLDKEMLHLFCSDFCAIYDVEKNKLHKIYQNDYYIPHDEMETYDGYHYAKFNGMIPLSKDRFALYGNSWIDIKRKEINISYDNFATFSFDSHVLSVNQLPGKENMIVGLSDGITIYNLDDYKQIKKCEMKDVAASYLLSAEKMIMRIDTELFIYNFVKEEKELRVDDIIFNICVSFLPLGNDQLLCGAINMVLLDLKTMKFTRKEERYSQNCTIMVPLGDRCIATWACGEETFAFWKY